MSWSLRLRHGDLVCEGSSLGQVTNQQKLVQDLRCAILEKRGMDNAHPRFGSILNGGFNDKGKWVDTIIGEDDIDFVVAQVEAELRRIGTEHQISQAARAKEDRYIYGESTLNNAELLASIDNINFVQAEDKLLVTVFLKTGADQPISIDIPISI